MKEIHREAEEGNSMEARGRTCIFLYTEVALNENRGVRTEKEVAQHEHDVCAFLLAKAQREL